MTRKRWRLVAAVLKVLAILVPVLDAQGQLVNDWTNPVSAPWESSSWSLGVLPAENQTVNITNAGYKAVDIDSETVATFPDSLTMSNLAVSAPSNALSTLLLNYAGLNTPVRVLNGCGIGANGTLQNLYSSFELDGVAGGALDISGGGAFIQQGGQTTASARISIRQGSIALTNGNMTLGDVFVGTFGIPEVSGSMIHNGGSVAADTLAVSVGTYELDAGTLYALNGTYVDNGSTALFQQLGGTNYGDIHVEDGANYVLNSGLCQGHILTVSEVSQFQQNGGLVQMEFLNVIGPVPSITIDDVIGFYLRQGQAQIGTLTINGNGLVEEDGGNLILTNNFNLQGTVSGGTVTENAYFMLVNGILSSPSISVGAGGSMNQRAGTNEISGGLTLNDTTYYETGGMLMTSYTGVNTNADFQQYGGAHDVKGVLSIGGSYELISGQLNVLGLYLRGTLNIGNGDFINNGLVDLGGLLNASTDVVFGQVRLSTNAVFNVSSGSARVYCQNSSGVGWTPGAFLVVSNWHSGGANAVYFGADATGLTAGQLAQVRFINPADVTPGYYAAQITSYGEIVPVPRPTLQFMRSGAAQVLTWTGNYRLLSATNVTGPYLPVSGASSPWTNLFSQPLQFFELASP